MQTSTNPHGNFQKANSTLSFRRHWNAVHAASEVLTVFLLLRSYNIFTNKVWTLFVTDIFSPVQSEFLWFITLICNSYLFTFFCTSVRHPLPDDSAAWDMRKAIIFHNVCYRYSLMSCMWSAVHGLYSCVFALGFLFVLFCCCCLFICVSWFEYRAWVLLYWNTAWGMTHTLKVFGLKMNFVDANGVCVYLKISLF